MKLARFNSPYSTDASFGCVIGAHVVAFTVLQQRAGTSYDILSDSRAYLAHLPDSENAARSLLEWGQQHFSELSEEECFLVEAVDILEPVEIVSLFDFGLTPRHLRNSLETLLKYEKDNPQTGPILKAIEKSLLTDKNDKQASQPESLPYYKCNMNSIVGNGKTIPWPVYTARLDIEPELAVVYGNSRQPVAGFCIFNDISARDVQAPEFIGGFCLTKDMGTGNQIGPYLVTVDEVGDPYDQEVTVSVNGKNRFKGSTSEISHKAEAVFAWLGAICPIKSGTVIGFGTIPGCTGLDFDDFLDPGDAIEISIERLGTLHCQFAEPQTNLRPSRWPVRTSLQKYID
jgi:2-keto-4-pentenoate hydratase/2-oxohepta-3-ene-1,7-dioic acid hydratase in catechol pathway